jgi:uncharacterized membrane protein YsdA (DUF1294 family)
MPVLIAAYAIVMSAAGFCICACDKRAAVKGKRRVSERALFVTAVLGGSAGVYAAMLIFRHKTRRLKFMLLMPLILLLQAGAALWALKVF